MKDLLKGEIHNSDYDKEYSNDGDGEKSCPDCGGTGFVKLEDTLYPEFKRCGCTYKRDLCKNIERGWPGLVKAEKVEKSLLTPYTNKNLWISGSRQIFRSYLRRTAIDKGVTWNFKVFSDVELMETWLATLIIKGQDEIVDPDIRTSDRYIQHISLNELASAYPFLVVILGAKSAANKEMPNVLLETLRIRFDQSKPTWIFDGTNPLAFGHVCYSEKLITFIDEEWDHTKINLGEENTSSPSTKKSPTKGSRKASEVTPSPVFTLPSRK